MKIEREVEFFDRFEETHGDYDVFGELAYRQLLRRFERWVKPRRGEFCLDLGCGSGAFTRRLARFDLDLVGIDISPRSIARANSLGGGPKYVTGDIMNPDQPAESVDIAVFSAALHHIQATDDRQSALREAFRVLRPGGRIFTFDPNRQSPSMWLYRDPRSPLFSQVGQTENEVLLTRSQITSELETAGFSGVIAEGIGGITYTYVEGRIARVLLPLYNVYELFTLIPGIQSRFGTFVTASGAKPR